MDLRSTFNTDEYNYDKARPGYPAELFEEIFTYSGLSAEGNALEIGIGTGQATQPFLENGCRVTAVELGDRLAEYCRQKFSAFDRFSVINSDFLQSELPENCFDIAFSATAFHWIPKDGGYAKLRTALKPGGVIALFWNHPFVSNTQDETNLASVSVYKKYRPSDKRAEEFDTSSCKIMTDELEQYGFSDIKSKIFRRKRTLTSDEYISLIRTYSDHIAMQELTKAAFEQDMKQAIDNVGGRINIYDTIDLYLAKNKK